LPATGEFSEGVGRCPYFRGRRRAPRSPSHPR
jgi:hypothetical protein